MMRHLFYAWTLVFILSGIGCGNDSPDATSTGGESTANTESPEPPVADPAPEPAPSTETTPPPSAPSPVATARWDDSNATAQVDESNFEIRFAANDAIHAGQAGTLSITIVPKGEFHLNGEFPTSVAYQGPEGVALPNPMGVADAEEFGESRAHFAPQMTASAAGEQRISARLEFAVCDPQRCIPQSQIVAMAVPVQ